MHQFLSMFRTFWEPLRRTRYMRINHYVSLLRIRLNKISKIKSMNWNKKMVNPNSPSLRPQKHLTLVPILAYQLIALNLCRVVINKSRWSLKLSRSLPSNLIEPTIVMLHACLSHNFKSSWKKASRMSKTRKERILNIKKIQNLLLKLLVKVTKISRGKKYHLKSISIRKKNQNLRDREVPS